MNFNIAMNIFLCACVVTSGSQCLCDYTDVDADCSAESLSSHSGLGHSHCDALHLVNMLAP